MSVNRAYPTDPLGAEDHGETRATIPCAARLNTIPLSWCTRPPGHKPPCTAPYVRPIETDDLGVGASKRRRY